MTHSVLLDTSFFIRLLNDEDPLHTKAKDYFKYFLENDILLKVSTISIAEYCVGGFIEELPLMNIQIVPFNLDHAKKTGQFAKAIFDEKNRSMEELKPRAIIPNDSKLFAQSDCDKSILYFVTSDKRSLQVYNTLSKSIKPNFKIINIDIPYNQQFGILDLR
ncbi:MAG: type II toxin-antitoxin system VapC family toxin [bacterium]